MTDPTFGSHFVQEAIRLYGIAIKSMVLGIEELDSNWQSIID
jgi:hypothetical protein